MLNLDNLGATIQGLLC